MINIKRNRNLKPIADKWLLNVKDFFYKSSNPRIILKKDSNKKIIKFNTYAQKIRFECLSRIFEKIKEKQQIIKYLNLLNEWHSDFDKIVLMSPENMGEQIIEWENKSKYCMELQNLLSDILVKYYDLVSKKYGHDLVESLNVKTCPYCNRQFIYTFKGRAKERPELDHFLPKSVYPLFCLSFYNLIPSCHSCNHIKSKEKVGINPYLREFKGKFILTDENSNKLNKSQIFRLTSKEIRIDIDTYDMEEKLNVDVLGLKDSYNKHTDYVKELIDKAMAYDRYARENLIESFIEAGYNTRKVYDFIWGAHLMDAEFEDRPLSKLTKDILDLIGIRRY